jgi:hypothetical protein
MINKFASDVYLCVARRGPTFIETGPISVCVNRGNGCNNRKTVTFSSWFLHNALCLCVTTRKVQKEMGIEVDQAFE